MAAVAMDIEVWITGMPEQGSYFAGQAKTPGRPDCGNSLPYSYGHATEEVPSVTLIAYELAEFPREREY